MKAGTLLLGAVLLGLPSRVDSADYYVSASGDDANDGMSESRPWRSLPRVNAAAFAAGDHVRFRGGDAFDGHLVFETGDRAAPGRPITIGSYGQGRATIRAGDGTAVLVKDVGHFVIKDLIVIGSGRVTNRGSGVKLVNELPGGTRLESIRIEAVDASGFGREGIFVGGNPPDRSQSGYGDVKIMRCKAHDNAYFGIYVTGVWDEKSKTYANRDVIIADCTANDNPGDPEYLENHSGSGILLDDVDGGRIEHCVAYNNGGLCNATAGGPVGIWAHAANRVTIQHCASYNNRTGRGNDGGGFDFDGGVTNSVMQYNYSRGNDGAGFLLYTYNDAPHSFRNNVVRYNISEGDCRKNRFGAIHVVNDGGGVRDVEVYNNTVHVDRATGGEPKAAVVHRTEDVHFRNNIFVTAGGVPLLEIGGGQGGLVFQGNNYWAEGKAFLIHDGGKTYRSLATWHRASGQETLRGRQVGLSLDPMLARPGAGQIVGDAHRLFELTAYRLKPGSSMIDAGLDLSTLFGTDVGGQDFWGNIVPQGRGLDIGAHEAR